MQNLKLRHQLLILCGSILLTIFCVNSFHANRSKVLREDLAALSRAHQRAVLDYVWNLAKAHKLQPFPGASGSKATPDGGSVYASIRINYVDHQDSKGIEELKSIIELKIRDMIGDLQGEERSSYNIEYTTSDTDGIIKVEMKTSYIF